MGAAGKVLGAAALALCVTACGGGERQGATAGGDWRAQMGQLRVAARGAEEDPEVASRWTTLRDYLGGITGLPVKIYESADYNGTIAALSSGQVDVASMAGGGYANVDAQVGELAAPILTVREAEGNTGYYSAVIVRADSPFRTIADLEGRAIGYTDLNSTSGYLFPRAKMREQGIDPDAFFGSSSFAGGHTQAVMALENGQFDAAVVNMTGGDPVNGFTSGPQFTMARKGLVRLEDFRIVWTAGPIPNAAIVVRTDRPQAMTDVVRGALAAVPYDHPKIWRDIGQPHGASYAAVSRAHYRDIIALREEAIAERRRSGGSSGGSGS
ncbi:phosphate/phosphite/phosphonate ABC transporter substrate-binding protein [Phenylobacterium sp.]|jgi:phosphonate transport system substrate-binding protein|uniref:phosphate/phosphite/phosphonate ABC transporter substrate-binding protein n=1 Tax=Phenylobacterium sp. TaxID=1871053 RepID=UPI002E35DD00|nr:phosphate/phosphite/phosphonate ABC transporter substrate-binding protein [Phenylobacterium sp.]HEX2560259.1 phosphate/phosphite/phosphonate ABC transporter substrate-binding protein [Phenylobacterium sp.]